MTKQKKINIHYFASLREQAGIQEEELYTAAKTAGELYQERAQKYGFQLSLDLLRLAINDRFEEFTLPLHSGDKVVFIPPVSGG